MPPPPHACRKTSHSPARSGLMAHQGCSGQGKENLPLVIGMVVEGPCGPEPGGVKKT